MSDKSDRVMNELIEEAVKELALKIPWKRAERLDTVSSSILQTSGVILTIIVGIFSLSIGKDTISPGQMYLTLTTQIILLAGCITFVLAMTFLVFSIRSREVITPEKINKDTYFNLLKEISKLNDKKKSLQDAGLTCLILGAVFTLLTLVILILRI
jgi:hypothetical protein